MRKHIGWSNQTMEFALCIAELAFKKAEKGENLQATLSYIQKLGANDKKYNRVDNFDYDQQHVDFAGADCDVPE